MVTIGAVKTLLASADGELAYLSNDCNRDVKRLLSPFIQSKQNHHHNIQNNNNMDQSSSNHSNSVLSADPTIQGSKEWFMKQQLLIHYRNGNKFIDFQSRELWAPSPSSDNNSGTNHGIGYGQWLCNLTSRLLIDCYYEHETLLQEQEDSQNASSSQNNSSQNSMSLLKRNSLIKQKLNKQNQHPKRYLEQQRNRQLLSSVKVIGNDMFLKLCLPLCQLRPSFAELLFPAIIDDLTSHTSFDARKLIRFTQYVIIHTIYDMCC